MVSVTAGNLESMCLRNQGTRSGEEEQNEKMRGDRGLEPSYCVQLCTRDHLRVHIWTGSFECARGGRGGGEWRSQIDCVSSRGMASYALTKWNAKG